MIKVLCLLPLQIVQRHSGVIYYQNFWQNSTILLIFFKLFSKPIDLSTVKV